MQFSGHSRGIAGSVSQASTAPPRSANNRFLANTGQSVVLSLNKSTTSCRFLLFNHVDTTSGYSPAAVTIAATAAAAATTTTATGPFTLIDPQYPPNSPSSE